jgi:hypothetical protein
MPGLFDVFVGGLMGIAAIRRIGQGLSGLSEEPAEVRGRRSGMALFPGARNRKGQVVRRRGMNGEELKATYEDLESLEDRIDRLRDLARKGMRDEVVRQKALSVLSRKCGGEWCTREKDYWGEVEAIFNEVRNSARYVRDPHGMDAFQAPIRTLQWQGGDCDCLSVLLASLLLSVGYPVQFRVIQTVHSSEWDHIYVLVGLPPQRPDTWVALDASVAEPAGWQAPEEMVKRYRDFEV